MQKKVATLFAIAAVCGVVLSNVTNAQAGDLIQLADSQMDMVTAGAAARIIPIGYSETFPSWAFGGTTTMWITSLDNAYSEASISVLFSSEVIHVDPLGQVQIKRKWGGAPVTVTNTGQAALKVQTS